MAAGISPVVDLAVGGERGGRHRDEIHDAVEAPFLADGQLDRNDLAGAVAVQRVERAVQAGPIAIETAQRDDARQPEAGRFGPHLFGLHFDAVHGVHHDQGRLGDVQRGAGIAEEVGEAWRIDEVDLGLLPLAVGEAGGERVLAGDFFVVEVGDGGTVVNQSEPVDGPGGQQRRRDELCLAASAVAHDCHVADSGGLVHLHSGIPPGAHRAVRTPRGERQIGPPDEVRPGTRREGRIIGPCNDGFKPGRQSRPAWSICRPKSASGAELNNYVWPQRGFDESVETL